MAAISGRKRCKSWQYCFEGAKAEYDLTGKTVQLSNISVHDFMEELYDNQAKIKYKQSTLRKYRSIINNHINKDLDRFKLRSLTSQQIQEYINHIFFIENYSKSHLSHLMSCLNLAINYTIVPCWYIKNNHMLYVKIPRKNNETEKEKRIWKYY